MAVGRSDAVADLRETIEGLVDYAALRGLIGWGDRVWGYNVTLEAVGASTPGPGEAWALSDGPSSGRTVGMGTLDLDGTLARLAEVAVANGRADDTSSGRDRVAMHVAGELMPRPSEMAATFDGLLDTRGPRAATEWFYRVCCDAGYVRRAAIARNVRWVAGTRWGDLEITINLSKPEKDPREIAEAGRSRAVGEQYPACQLCMENEGYPGRGAADAHGAHPARQNLRIVPIRLGGERWGLQYSPYAYFDEHCIAMSARHRPMHVDRATMGCLLDFVDLLPHYFVGSNADLPVVGGSILSHDHFQGGAHEFPMMRAPADGHFSLSGLPGVDGSVLRWPLSVLRLTSEGREELLDACDHVIGAWRAWSDESVGVVARTTDGMPHNTVTPIVRRVGADGSAHGGAYEAYLALRCNVTSEEHPLGVFHPHEQWHHIKRENIGLIEVMGLAILPPRLVGELGAVRGHMLDATSADMGAEELLRSLSDDPASAPHAAWAAEVFRSRRSELDERSAEAILRDEVGAVFAHVLEDTGVFKWDAAGRAAQRRFVESL